MRPVHHAGEHAAAISMEGIKVDGKQPHRQCLSASEAARQAWHCTHEESGKRAELQADLEKNIECMMGLRISPENSQEMERTALSCPWPST